MANKVTQLVNESGDNLYPLAGGMAADSITTAMLKDSAVTSDKIDWTTLVNASHTGKVIPATSVPANTGVNMVSVDVSAGDIVIVAGYLEYSASATGSRDAIIRLGENNVVSVRVPATSGVTRVPASAILTPTSDSTVYLRANHSNSGSLNVAGRLTYMIIKRSV